MATVTKCPPHARQAEFLKLTCEEALYGGAAGGGKTHALLMWLAEGVHVPTYSGVFFRRTYPQLEKSNDSPISKSRDLYRPLGGTYNDSKHTWLFPSGAKVEFGHLPLEKSVEDYQGPAYHRIAYDELTQFSENQYTYLFSRQRRHVAFPISMGVRASANPGGTGHLWVKNRFITLEAQKAIQALGVRTPSPAGMVFWPTEKRAFVPARVADNPTLDIEDYIERMLTHLPPVLRERLLRGDWSIVENAILRADWLRYYDMRGEIIRPLDLNGNIIGVWDVRTRANRFATIDTAGTSKQIAEEKKKGKASWSVCAIWDQLNVSGKAWLFLRYLWRERVGFTDLLSGLRRVCGRDGEWRPKTLWIENGHIGPQVAEALGDEGYSCELLSTATKNIRGETGMPGKVERSTDLQLMMEQGRIFLPQYDNDWKPGLEAEWLSWTGDEDEPADQVDVASYAAIVAQNQSQSWGGTINTAGAVATRGASPLTMARGGKGLRW